MFKNCKLVKSYQNGVQRRSHWKRLPATRSTYAFNRTHKVKGHRAGRLFNYNNKMVEKESQNEHFLSSNDEKLISLALSKQQQNHEEVKKAAKTRLENIDLIADGEYKDMVRDHCNQILQSKGPTMTHVVKKQFPKLAKIVTERQKRRHEFLTKPENKICFICGTKGHTAKQCTSKKKQEQRHKRTKQYKQYLGRKGVYKVDVDAAYQKILAEKKEVEKQNSDLRNEIIQLKCELATAIREQHQARQEGKDTSPAQVMSEKKEQSKPGLVELAKDVKDQVTGCLKCSDKQGVITGKSNYSSSLAQRSLCFSGLCAMVLSIVLIISVIATGFTPKFSGYQEITHNTKPAIPMQEPEPLNITESILELYDTVKQVINVEICVPSLWTVLKFVFFWGIAMKLLSLFISLLRGKVANNLKWKAIDMYRNQLKQGGYSFRLPYKVSQIETESCPGTKLNAFLLCYTAVRSAVTLPTVAGMYASALVSVLRGCWGKLIFISYHARPWFRMFRRAFSQILCGTVSITIAIIAAIFKVVMKVLQTFAIIVWALRKIIATLILVVLSYDLIRVYIMGHSSLTLTWSSEIHEILRAKLDHYAGMMTLNLTSLVQLITARCSHIKVHDIIDILVKKIEHLFKCK